MSALFWLLLGLVVGAGLGWNAAHVAVAAECERLGGFFVGKKIFKCVEVIHADD